MKSIAAIRSAAIDSRQRCAAGGQVSPVTQSVPDFSEFAADNASITRFVNVADTLDAIRDATLGQCPGIFKAVPAYGKYWRQGQSPGTV